MDKRDLALVGYVFAASTALFLLGILPYQYSRFGMNEDTVKILIIGGISALISLAFLLKAYPDVFRDLYDDAERNGIGSA